MDDHIGDNPFNLLNIDSPYYDMEEIHTNLCSDAIADSTFQYTSLHLNIQSLPAKFDKLKLLISELHDQNIDLDLILLCETFLTDNIQNQFNIAGYNLVCKNRTTTRGGVAIYIKKF